MTEDNERREDIEYWWGGAGGCFFTALDPLEDRLPEAFLPSPWQCRWTNTAKEMQRFHGQKALPDVKQNTPA